MENFIFLCSDGLQEPGDEVGIQGTEKYPEGTGLAIFQFEWSTLTQ